MFVGCFLWAVISMFYLKAQHVMQGEELSDQVRLQKQIDPDASVA